MSKDKTFQTLDLYLSAFLVLHNQKPNAELINGKVVFNFQISDTLYSLVEKFNSGESVPVTAFVTAVKALRGRMLTLKSGFFGGRNE